MCECRDTVNKKLAEHNARIGTGFTCTDNSLNLSPPFIVLEKIDDRKRGKIPHLVATCCPFCGTHYDAPQ